MLGVLPSNRTSAYLSSPSKGKKDMCAGVNHSSISVSNCSRIKFHSFWLYKLMFSLAPSKFSLALLLAL